MLNEFVNKCTPNKLYSVTLQEYLMLSKCLNNKQTLKAIQFNNFLDKFKQIHLKHMSKKYVNNLKLFQNIFRKLILSKMQLS